MDIKRVLVTGSAGFIGFHVAQFLKEQGLEVATYDKKNGQDLLDEKTLAKSLKSVDAICHLAAVGDVYLAAEKPDLAQIAGPTATALLVKAASSQGIKKIVYASTWEVYGKIQHQPVDEKHPCFPDHPYSIAKYAGELIVQSRLFSVPWVILRLGTAYGTHMRKNAVIPLFIKKAKSKEPIIIQGDGSQKRQFTHVKDITKAFYLSLADNVSSEIFNIVSQESVSIGELAKTITDRFPTNIEFKEKRPGDVEPAYVSSKKAKQLLAWEANTSFAEGIKELL